VAAAGGCGEPHQPFGFVMKPVPLFHVAKPSQGVYIASAGGFTGNVLGIAWAPGLFEELGQFAQGLCITVAPSQSLEEQPAEAVIYAAKPWTAASDAVVAALSGVHREVAGHGSGVRDGRATRAGRRPVSTAKIV